MSLKQITPTFWLGMGRQIHIMVSWDTIFAIVHRKVLNSFQHQVGDFVDGLLGFLLGRKYKGTEESTKWMTIGCKCLDVIKKYKRNSDWNFANKLHLLVSSPWLRRRLWKIQNSFACRSLRRPSIISASMTMKMPLHHIGKCRCKRRYLAWSLVYTEYLHFPVSQTRHHNCPRA